MHISLPRHLRLPRALLLRALLAAALLLVAAAPALAEQGRATVVWINIDGMRGDYVELTGAPFLRRLMDEQAYSRQLIPVFPSLTFPTHVSMATGVPVSGHGISGNTFYDSDTQQSYNFPPDAVLLRAEPIWNTATRQGIRTAVVDWPVSHRQQHVENAAAYYGQSYEGRLSDEERLQNVLNIWRDDEADEPLRLLLGYASRVDTVGHNRGPDSPELKEAMLELDRQLEAFLAQAVALFERQAGPEDELWVFITTDHGMSEVHTVANLNLMLAETFSEEMLIVTGGSVANVHLDKLPEEERPGRVDAMLAQLEQYDWATAWRKGELPEHYGYNDPSRVGELVVSLDRGYTFTRSQAHITRPVDRGGPLGMHAYPADANPEMEGLMIVYRHRQPLGGLDLGKVDQLQLHPTVARILGIEPAEGATAEPIEALVGAEAVAGGATD